MKIFGAGGAILAELAGLFLLGLALWLGLKCCTDGTCGYMKIVEVCGLSWMIDVPQKIVRLLLVAWKQNLLATASPTLFLDNPSTTNRTHVFLSIVDVIDIWWLAVLSLGSEQGCLHQLSDRRADHLWHLVRLPHHHGLPDAGLLSQHF